MNTSTLLRASLLACVGALGLLAAGCSTAKRSAPNAVPVVNMNLDRKDYEVMGDVEETSEVTSYLNIVHIVDNDPQKMIIFGFRTFEDQYEEVPSQGIVADALAWAGEIFSGGSPTERANYTALTAAEAKGADIVVPKRVQRTMRGFSPFYTVETATVKGKALRLKEDSKIQR